MEQAMVPISVTILSSLVSGLVTLGISTSYTGGMKAESRSLRCFDTSPRIATPLLGSPIPDASSRFFAALNEAFVIFHDSHQVLVALNDFHKYPGRARDNTVELFKAMCNDLRFDRKWLDDEYFLTPFVPGGGPQAA